MRITITRADIENGRKCDPDCCPIGRALSRAGVTHFDVAEAGVVVANGGDAATRLPWPVPVKAWILAYDSCEPVEPISFELSIPGERRTRATRALRAHPSQGLAVASAP